MNKELEYLANKIEEKRQQLLEAVGDGACKDFAAYTNMTGQIRGLLTAQRFVIDLANQLERNDD